MVQNKTKDLKNEEANALAFVRDWEETEIKNEAKIQASK